MISKTRRTRANANSPTNRSSARLGAVSGWLGRGAVGRDRRSAISAVGHFGHRIAVVAGLASLAGAGLALVLGHEGVADGLATFAYVLLALGVALAAKELARSSRQRASSDRG